MLRPRRWHLLAAVAIATACQATGTGWFPSSADPATKATFGFVYDGTSETLSGSYHDRAADVDFKGRGVIKAGPPPAGVQSKGGCLMGTPSYESTNKDRPGQGTLLLIVCDLGGNGPSPDDDMIFIDVIDGPYAGYFNSGNPSGNITVTSP